MCAAIAAFIQRVRFCPAAAVKVDGLADAQTAVLKVVADSHGIEGNERHAVHVAAVAIAVERHSLAPLAPKAVLCAYIVLAATFDIPKRAITIVAGTSSRSKIVELAGITEERVRSRMEA